MSEYDFVFACVLPLHFQSKMKQPASQLNKQKYYIQRPLKSTATVEAVKRCENAYISHNLQAITVIAAAAAVFCCCWCCCYFCVYKNCIEPYLTQWTKSYYDDDDF